MHEAFKSAWSRGPFRVGLRCELEFTGPLHVGTGEALSSATDAPVLRDADGEVWLPGSSVRGVLADWCQREAPLLGVDRAYVRRLFGVTPGRSAGSGAEDWQGRLTVLDVDLKSIAPAQVRDHVKIDRKWGAAATGAKFDQEIAHPRSGTLRLIYDGDGPDDPELALLRSAAEALREGLLAFGGKTGWGLGSARIKAPATPAANGFDGLHWSWVDRTEPENLSEHLKSKLPGNGKRRNGRPASAKSGTGMDKRPNYSAPRAREKDEPVAWSWLRLDLSLPFDGPMLVAALDTTRPDDNSNFARERREADAAWQVGPDGRPVLAGSALRGPLRSDAERIAKTLGLGDLAETLFGSEQRQGLIRVEEGRMEGDPKTVLLNHVSIDRVTGFAAEARLFNVAALASPCFRSGLLVRWDAGHERHRQAVALLLFVLRDGEQRGLWIGSRTTRGYGYARTVEVRSARWSLVAAASRAAVSHLAVDDDELQGNQSRRAEDRGSDSEVPRCRQEGQCGQTKVPKLGESLEFVDGAWKSALNGARTQ